MSEIDLDIAIERKGFHLDSRLHIAGRGITVLLGPSGSGKTTLLRTLAGLERPQRGHLRVGGSTWFDATKGIFLSPQKRRAGMVFQDYALFPRMTVSQNIAYGLDRHRRRAAVNYWLDRMRLDQLADRLPHQLSGGQRQRVALARALAPEPDLLLLDEPFSAIDASLRRQLRDELSEAVEDLSCPVLMVTHDLEEARYLADNVGVLVDGSLRAMGAAQRLFAYPGSREVATVLGWTNYLPVQYLKGRSVAGSWGELVLDHEPSVRTSCLAIKPEHVRIDASGQSGLHAMVMAITDVGAVRELSCRLHDGTMLRLHRPWDESLPVPGTMVYLDLPLPYVRPLAEEGPVSADIVLLPATRPGIRDGQDVGKTGS